MSWLGSLSFLYPGALAFFALTPLLVLAYLARERPRRVRVSSLLTYRGLGGLKARRLIGWPRLNWLFFLELLILCLAVLAMASPYVIHRSREIAVVLDNSAATQVRLPNGSTRFKTAAASLEDELNKQDSANRVAVYVTAPQPHEIAAAFDSPGHAHSAISGLEPTDAPLDPGALSDLLGRLASDAKFSAVFYAGAALITPPIPSRLHVAVFDAKAPNYALSSFKLRRESFGAPTLHASIGVANFSPSAQTLKVAIEADGRVLSSAEKHLTANQVGAIDFPRLPLAAVYRANLQPVDGFALDNAAYATASAVKSTVVLFVSPSPADASGLGALPGVKVISRTPDKYTPGDLALADVAIFEYSVPKTLPGVNTLLVMPPPNDPVFRFVATPSADLTVTGWQTADPLTDAVNFRLLNLRRGEYFGVHPWMRAVVSGSRGALMLRGVRQGRRFAATGFNPFPYLGRRNLPMSILTLNMLSYLAGLGSNATSYHTGEPWLVPAGISTIITPAGRKIAVTAGAAFTDTAGQGIYQLVAARGQKTLRAVNLDDPGVSDLAHQPAVRVESGASGPPTVSMERLSYSPYLLAAILALAFLEALIVYRRRRIITETQP